MSSRKASICCSVAVRPGNSVCIGIKLGICSGRHIDALTPSLEFESGEKGPTPVWSTYVFSWTYLMTSTTTMICSENDYRSRNRTFLSTLAGHSVESFDVCFVVQYGLRVDLGAVVAGPGVMF